jgi:hypothetical protein
MLRSAVCLLLAAGSWAETIDRIAVAFQRQVITESAILDQIRVTAFLNEEPVVIDRASKRRAADQLLEQALIRREMELSRYPVPIDAEIPPLLEQFRKDNYSDPEVFRSKLAEYKISEDLVGRTLLNQAAILRFIDMRFRPAVAVSDGEVEIYYRDQFAPNFEKENPGKAPPDIEDIREKLEQLLAAERVDRALDQWLIEARKQARVRYFEEAFQ